MQDCLRSWTNNSNDEIKLNSTAHDLLGGVFPHYIFCRQILDFGAIFGVQVVCILQLPSPQRPSTPSSPNTTRRRPLTLLCHHCQKFAKHNTADCENVTSLNTYELALLNEKFYALNVSEEVTTQNLVTLRFYVNHAEVLTPHIYTTNNKAKSTE